MRRLVTAVLATTATVLVALPTAAAHADGVLNASGQATYIIGAGHPSTPFTVSTGRDGDLTLDAQVEQGGVPVAGIAAIHVVGHTAASPIGDFVFDLDGTGLDSGTYQLVGTVSVTASDNSGVYSGALHSPIDSSASPSFTVDRDAPDGDVQLSRSWFRPTSNGTYDAIDVTSTGTADSGNRFISVVDSSNTEVYFFAGFAEFPAGTWETTYDGRDNDGMNLPAGQYTLRIVDAAGNVGPSAVFTVQHLVNKTFTKTVTAKGSKILQQPGACSTVQSPSTHGWAGSITLASNSKCHKSVSASIVVTAHGVKVPAAAAYSTVQVNAYGGAARHAAGSRAQMFYAKGTSGDITAQVSLGSAIGNHAGRRVAATGVLGKDNTGTYLVWYAVVGGGDRYDLKSFTVTVRYQIWQ